MNSKRRGRANYQQRFDQYLNQYRRRSKTKDIAITVGAIIFAAVTISLFTAVLADTLAYSNWLYYPARFLLVISLICLLVYLLWKPGKHLKVNDGAAQIEASVPAFEGRAETYIDMKRRNVRSPFVSLLAKDATRRAANTPVKSLLPLSEIIGPVVAGSGLLVLAAWLFTAMPSEWRAGMHHLWFGWYKTDILPERSIATTPGDTKIRLGDSLLVTANARGFESDFAQLHIKRLPAEDAVETGSSTNGNWEIVEMNRQPDGGFSFTLYGVSNPLEYYVSSAFTKSDRYNVEVVIPPKVESIQLSYRFPDWTRQEPVTVAKGDDIAAVEGTQVDLLITTDKPLTHGELILNDTASDLQSAAPLRYKTTITVANEDGKYQIAELLGDDRIMLTPEYSITVTEDSEPTISFTKPGGDWSATAIEEVTVAATAADDFEVEEVLLYYSVNGSEWISRTLSKEENYRHTFMLEDFKNEIGGQLLAGDLVTYYAEAKDRDQTVATDIQFIDVRPFERRFTQSQQAGQGGGGGQQEPPPGEISQRQKEILIATWNLIRDQEKNALEGSGSSSGSASGTGGGGINTRGLSGFGNRGIGNNFRRRQNASAQNSLVNDSAALLSELQNTLAEQAETLAKRAEARQLLNNDPKVAQFVEYMRKAAEAMRPSAEQLSSMSLQEAVTHQQQALQFLRRGELLFNDITVNQGQSEGSGGGNNAGRDMAEIYELEMDLAKNQYETPDAAPQGGGSQDQSADDAFEKLKELARRQQELAKSASSKDELTSAERWEQEKLRRELEELKRELEQLEREQSASGEQSQQSESQQSSQSQSQQEGSQQEGSQQNQGESQSGQGGQQGNSSETRQALQNLEDALREMQSADQNNNSTTPEQQQQAMQAASEKLQESLDNIEQARQQRLQSQLADASDSVRDLTRQQNETAQELQQALQDSMDARLENRFESGLTPQRTEELATEKRAMQRQLEEVQQQIADAIKRFEEDAPETTERLQQALDDLEDNKAAELMGISGDMIEDGMAPQAALREPRITEALRNLQNDLSAASGLATDEAQQPTPETLTAADATRSLQQTRRLLTEAINRARGDNGGNQELQRLDSSREGSQGSQQAQSEGQQSGEGQQSQQGQQQGQADGQTANGSASSLGSNRGTLSTDQTLAPDTQLIREATEQLERMGNSAVEGLSDDTVDEFSEIAQRLRTTNGDENNRRIDAEVRLLLRQLDQLELQVYSESQGLKGVRTGKRSETPKGYDRRSADYFRRLSEGNESQAGS